MKQLDLKRKLYLCCYDISDDANRKSVHRIVQSFASGGQKSAYECFLSTNERSLLVNLLNGYIDDSDSLVLQLITNTKDIKVLGVGVKAVNLGFIFLG